MSPGRPSIFVGIDGGGTSLDLKFEDPATGATSSMQRPGATLTRDGAEVTARAIADAIRDVAISSGRPCRVHAVVGLAGADDARSQDDLHRRIRLALKTSAPTKPSADVAIGSLRICPDSHIALESAFPAESGSVIIVGTGSIVIARTVGGRWCRVGGWGYKLGDEGGGHAIGLAGLQIVTNDFDGRPTELGQRLRAFLSTSTRAELIKKIYVQHWPVQQLAPVVVQAAEEGDRDGLEILKAQSDKLVSGLSLIEQQVQGDALKRRVALVGGLSQHAFYRSILESSIRRLARDWALSPLHPNPVDGALNLAKSDHEP